MLTDSDIFNEKRKHSLYVLELQRESCKKTSNGSHNETNPNYDNIISFYDKIAYALSKKFLNIYRFGAILRKRLSCRSCYLA